MPSKCFVAGCRSNYNASAKGRVFSFPKDEELKKLWIQAINREDKREPSKSSKICEHHFKPEDFITNSEFVNPKTQEVINIPLQKYRLSKDAVPSVFTNLHPIRRRRQPQSSNVTESPILEVEDSQHSTEDKDSSSDSGNMRRCVVPGCRSNFEKPYVSVFHFPKSPGFRNLWLKKIGCPLMNVKEHSVVCIKHFEKKFIVDGLTETYGSGRKRIGIKPGAVPTIFQAQEIDNPSEDIDKSQDTMKVKDVRSVSTSEVAKAADDEEEESMDSAVSETEETNPTTDRPFIEVIKPNDFQAADEPSTTEEVFEDTMSSPFKPSPNSKSSSRPNSNSKQRNISSPFRNLPPVNVNEEEKLNAQKDLFKSSKRSLSTCSISSMGSSGDAVKVQTKRRKVEKPAPTVIGKKNDCYCWVCHRENVVLNCIDCPRAYHTKCAGEDGNVSDWVCPECKRTLAAETMDTRSSVLSEISLDKLCNLLRFSLNKMKHRAGVAFHQPVSLAQYPMYLHYVIHPMDFSLLEKNIMEKRYGCTEAFLSDVKWILHNSCVFNGSHHPLSSNAKAMVKACDNDMQEIEVCPDCFMHNIVRNKYWFSEVCHKPHPLVWAKLKGFPYWPAKVVRIANDSIDARFFGAHDRAWVPISQCYHLSKEMPTSSKPKKKGNYETALDELSFHVELLIQKYGAFEYAPYRTVFDPENKKLMYHGINLDMAAKEETQSDIPPAIRTEDASSNKAESETNTSKDLNESKDSDALKTDADSNSASKITLGESSLSEKESNKVTENEPQAEAGHSSDQQSSLMSQRKKIELALQRIKGYISNDIDEDDKESDVAESQPEPKEPLPPPKEPEAYDKEDDICLADLIKARALPPIDLPTLDDVPEKEAPPVLDAAKKDSFSLKLIETIASCKAKLGISGDMDKSDSDDSDSSEDDEEDEDEAEEESEDENGENQSEENNSKRAKSRRKETSDGGSMEEDASDESSSESDAESVSSNTDIEGMENAEDALCAKKDENVTEPLNITDNKGSKSPIEKEVLSKNTASNTVSANVSVSGETISSKTLDNGSNLEVGNKSTSKNVLFTASENDKSDKEKSTSPAARSRSVSSNALRSSTDELTDTDMQVDAIEHQSVSKTDKTPPKVEAQSTEGTKTDKTPTKVEVKPTEGSKTDGNEMEDDDIYICPPVRAPTPPLICLDDGTETEPEENAESNLTENKPSNISHPSLKLPPPDKKPCPESTDKYVAILKSAKLIPQNARKTSLKRPIREVTSEDDSSDGYEFAPKVPLSGAIRTFGNRERNTTAVHQVLQPEKPYSGILLPSEGCSQINSTMAMNSNSEKVKRPMREVTSENDSSDGYEFAPKVPLSGAIRTFGNRERNTTAVHQVLQPEKPYSGILLPSGGCSQTNPTMAMNSNSEEQRTENEDAIPNSTTDPVSELAAKDAEILKLKKKLACLISAFQLQQWKSTQEKSELRHNMNLIVMEMRSCLEADKKQTVETLAKTLEREKQRCIEETKKKQWCAYCLQESRYACCWNTSYCTVACQKRHIGEHRKFCTQLRPKSKELVPTTTGTDSNEGKKVLVLNVLSNKDAKSPGDSLLENRTQISLSKVMSPKHSIQIVSTSSPQQYVLAKTGLKPASSPAAVSQKSMSKADNPDVELGNNAEEKQNSVESKNQEHSSAAEQNVKKAEPSLEEIYFPSPPTICFEGLDTALPDESIHFDDLAEASESHASDNELTIAEESSAEEDILSENDEADNEMVSIGRGIDIKAKSLNRCLIYGRDAKKLTRCLVDVIFPGSMLSVCSAFGNKSNVTKLTRAALPYNKVEAIIDFVRKRYPKATRSEIVLSINMKCKEARTLVAKGDSSGKGKRKFRRLLGKEQNEDDAGQQQEAESSKKQSDKEKDQEPKDIEKSDAPSAQAGTSNTVKPKVLTVLKKSLPNVVSLQNVTNSNMTQHPLGKPPLKPNILRMSREVLIRPKYLPNAVPNKLLLPPPSTVQYRNRSPTIRSLLNLQNPMSNLPKETGKFVFPVGMLQKAVISSPSTKSSAEASDANASPRPYFILGSSSQRPGVSTAQHRPIAPKK